MGKEVVAACAEGPKANDQYAAVHAAFISALAALNGATDIGAQICAMLAQRLQQELKCNVRGKDEAQEGKEEVDSLTVSNLAMVIGYLCAFGLISAKTIYTMLRLR